VSESGPPLFKGRRSYPGTSGGPFEVIVTYGERFERIPGWLFAGIVLAIWGLAALAFGRGSLYLSGFSFLDWGILTLLPRLKRSFGPPKFTVLLLSLLRWPFAALTGPWEWISQCIGSLLVIYSFAIEPLWLEVTYHSLKSPKLAGIGALRVLHLGDLHMERATSREQVLVNKVRALAPDLILFSGDFLSFSSVHDDAAQTQVVEVLSQLDAPLGIYAVSGSPPVDPPSVLGPMLADLKLVWVRDQVVRVHRSGGILRIVGLACSHQPALDHPRLEAIVGKPSDEFTILLYHSPDLAPLAERIGIDLQFSGHTHGGQVRLPLVGAIYTSSLYGKRFESGEYRLGRMTLFVTRGIGLEGRGAPRVRFLCRPEIAVWDLIPDDQLGFSEL
jgi:predicted MPP superfamily phosphohydrolase